MTTPFFSKLLRPAFHFIWIFTSCLGLLAYVPLTYRQILGTHLLPWLNYLISMQPILLIVVTGSLVFSIFRIEHPKDDPSPEDKRELIAILVVAILLGFWRLPLRLSNDWTSLGWSFATMIPSFWLSFYDLRAMDSKPSVSAKSWALIFSGVFAAVLTTLTLNYFYHQEADSTVVVILALLIGAIFSLAELIFSQFNFTSEDKFTSYGVLIGSMLGYFFWQKICTAISFFGNSATFWSFALGICIGLSLASISSLNFTDDRPFRFQKSHLFSFVWGLNPLRSFPKLSFLVWLFWIALAYFLSNYVSQMDWNGLLQELFSAILLVLAFFNIFVVFDQIFKPTRLTLILQCMTTVVIVFVFSVFFIRVEKIKTSTTNHPLFTLAKSLIVPDEINTGFYEFLQTYTNLKDEVKIDLKNVTLSPKAQVTLAPFKPHVFVFVVDSLRRDYLSAYNPARATPEIEKFAAQSKVFTNAYTRFGSTGLSEPSIWAGRMIPHQMYPAHFSEINILEKLMTAEKYKFWISRDSILREILKTPASSLDLDKGVGNQELDFCKTSQEIIDRFKAFPQQESVFVYSQPQNIHASVLARQKINYEDGIKKIDKCFGQFTSQLEQLNLLDKSIIILAAGHGDSLGEEGRYGHSYTIYPEVMRIPLIIHLPKSIKDQVQVDTDRLALTTDIAPTLEMLLGYNVKPNHWSEGVSLFFRKKEAPSQRLENEILIMSSYGAVAGIMSDGGTKIYISDGVNFNDYLYEINEKGATNLGVNPDDKLENEKLIREKILDLYNYYGVHL